jgi:hypothetical protein
MATIVRRRLCGGRECPKTPTTWGVGLYHGGGAPGEALTLPPSVDAGRQGRHHDVEGDDRESVGEAQIGAGLTVRVDGVRHQRVAATRTALRIVLRGHPSAV